MAKETTTMTSTPTFPGCSKTSRKHARGEPWTCRVCNKQACSHCAKHRWTAKGGYVVFGPSGPQLHGTRSATCGACARRKIN